MLADARQGKFQVLLVWACDRLARSVRHFLEVLDELNHLGVEFVSFREQLDTGGPLGRAVVVIISVPLMMIVRAWFAVADTLSVTRAVKAYCPTSAAVHRTL
jgi:DNA invertase Pin-like site-specific DNA recombinase